MAHAQKLFVLNSESVYGSPLQISEMVGCDTPQCSTEICTHTDRGGWGAEVDALERVGALSLLRGPVISYGTARTSHVRHSVPSDVRRNSENGNQGRSESFFVLRGMRA